MLPDSHNLKKKDEWPNFEITMTGKTASGNLFLAPSVSNITIRYNLPIESNVKIEVFNILGQRITTLVDGWIGNGEREVVWQPTYLASELYFFRMYAKPLDPNSEYKAYQKVRKMMFIN